MVDFHAVGDVSHANPFLEVHVAEDYHLVPSFDQALP